MIAPDREQPARREPALVEQPDRDQEHDPDRERDPGRVVDVEAEPGDDPTEEGRQLVALAEAPEEQGQRHDDHEDGGVLAHREAADHEHRVVHADEQGAEEGPAPRQLQHAEERVAGGNGQQADDGMQEPHVEEVDAAEQVPELAPADEEERGAGQVVAHAERVARRVRVVLSHAHDRELVRAHLHGPAVEREQVERRADRGRSGGVQRIGPGDPRQAQRAERKADDRDGEAGQPEPEHLVAVAVDDVDGQRNGAEREPHGDGAEWQKLLPRASARRQARSARALLSDHPHEGQRVATCGEMA